MDYGKEYVRLADRVLAAKRIHPPAWWAGCPEEEVSRHQRWLQGAVAASEVILIDNVAEYLYAGTDQEEWNPERDFPCLAPPFPAFWMEYRRPSRIYSEVHGTISTAHYPDTVGVLFSACDLSEDGALEEAVSCSPDEERFLRDNIGRNWAVWGDSLQAKVGGAAGMRDLMREMGHGMNPRQAAAGAGLGDGETFLLGMLLQWHFKYGEGRDKLGDPSTLLERVRPLAGRWLVRAMLYYYDERCAGVSGPWSVWSFRLGDDGCPLKHAFTPYDWMLPTSPHARPLTREFIEQHSHLNAFIFPCLMAITFMHCKNVTVRAGEPHPDWNKRQERKHGRPLVKFKTLHIQPMVQVISQSRAAGESGGSPLHVCRGHFKDYRERGLFGRHRGIYWWDNYVRGSVTRGVVFKDYSVN